MAKEAEKKSLEIKRFDVITVGKIMALLGAFAGFIFGIVMSALVYQLSNSPLAEQMPNFQAIGWKQMIGLPFWYLLIFGIFWGITSMLFALIYNQIAKSGGLKLAVK